LSGPAKKHTQRIRTAKGLIERGLYDWEIKLLLSEKFECSKRTVERYIFKARALCRKDTGKDRESLRHDAIAFYKSVVSDMHVSPKDRLKAQERIDKLLGLEQPTVIHQRVEGQVTHTHETIVEAARKDDETRDLLLQLSRRISTS
jgi:hypothetical protein